MIFPVAHGRTAVFFPPPDVRVLPQLYRADEGFALRHDADGVIASVLAFARPSRPYSRVSIDSRLAMLLPGMYPCIPGWHCDDFHRPDADRARGTQPDLARVLEEAPSEHFMILFGDSSLTQFVDEEIDLDLTPPAGRSLYGWGHEQIVAKAPRVRTVQPGELFWFSPLSWHQGTAATHAGWRWFLRVTFSNHREARNEIRTQTQVYMTDPFAGW